MLSVSSFAIVDEMLYECLLGKWVLQGDLDIYSKTASKYDDCRLIHLPGLQLGFVTLVS